MSDPLDWLRIGGGLAGIAALAWRLVDEYGAYLRVSVTVTCEGGHVKAITTVDNKGNRPKPLQYSFLLVGPEEEGPVETGNVLAKALGHAQRIAYTNDLSILRPGKPFYSGPRAVIPLPFYYGENVDIADETLSYAAPIDMTTFEAGAPYAVRFFLFPTGRLHRSTADTFFAPPQPAGA